MPRLRPPFRPLAWGLLGAALLAAAPSASLRPGEAVERGLAAGESQVFPVELAAGRPWLVTVEQRGIDVVVEVSGPDGKRLAAVDSPLDRQGPETVLVEPAVAGVYRCEVRAQEKAAPPGRYEIRIEEADPHRLDAERAVTRAGERYLEGTPEARRQAIVEYQKALAAWRTLGDRRQEARSLYALAVLSRLVDDTRPALARGQEVLPLWQALGDRLWEGATWNEIGLDHWLLGESAEGRAAFEKALALRRQIGDRYGEGVSRSNLCLMDLSRGELRAGLACYEGALPVLHEVQAGALEGSALLSVGRVYDVLGEPDQARERYQQALARMRATGDKAGEARTLNHLGLLHFTLGDYQEATVHFGQALEAFRALDDRRWQANVLHNLGLVDQSLGERPRALSYFEQALRLRREVGDAKGEAATLAALAQVERLLGRPREALAYARQALAQYRSTADRFGEGFTLTELGRAALALGDTVSALASFDQAVELLGATGSLNDEAAALSSRGDAYASLGDPAKGMESLRQALELARSTGYRPAEVRAELAIARAERRLGRDAEARAHAEAALALSETLRTRIGSPDLRASYSDLTHDAYELEIDLLMAAHRAAPAAGFDRTALEATERARARTLLELLAEARVDVHEGADPHLLDRRSSLLRRLSAKAERALRERPANAGERAALEEDRDAILRDLDVVEAQIRERSPGYAALVQPRPLSAPQIQALLDPDTLLLSYSLGEARSVLWAVTSTSIASFELPGRATVEAAARRFHEELSVHDPAGRARQAAGGEALGRMLLGPVAERLDRQRLVVVPDGALEYVPFGALQEPGRGALAMPILERHEVVYLPSASALAIQRQVLERRPPAPKQLLVLADPVFDANDPRLTRLAQLPRPASGRTRGGDDPGPGIFERLPGSRREAEAIVALAPAEPAGGTRLALDFDASRPEALSDRLSAYRIVHFATHGILDAEHPALSGLALSMVDRAGQPQAGFLHLRDVYNLRLGADLVVLSGCRTALGKLVRGEGLIGLTRGFLYAGAPRVVASLWRVEDLATAALMTRFYRALWIERLRPAAALRAAQLSLAQQRRWRDPYFWAGFVLEGDWR
ncbi:MAG TPA: CHAT domain-containing protein [Thermoanaerobaculia bacterium]|jgi:CHAT domain-containing protein/predicted negative regulator of RcsB-dependent stress response|nr:CHAT domain-containing protein [Thermoanaerobaculia bacterium]